MRETESQLLDGTLTKQHFSCRVYHSYFFYIRKHFPHVDLEALALNAGLPLSYLQNESNFVSVTFDQKFTALCIQETGLPDLCYRVGMQSVSPDVLGRFVAFLIKHTLSLPQIYGRLPYLTKAFSKVTVVEIEKSSSRTISYLFRAKTDGLTAQEIKALKENYGNILENTIAHYAAIPTVKLLPLANITHQIIGRDLSGLATYRISIDIPSEGIGIGNISFSIYVIALAMLSFFIAKNGLNLGTEISSGYAMIVVLIGAIIGLVLKVHRSQSSVDQALRSLMDLDQRYNVLEKAEDLLRKTSTCYSFFVPWEFMDMLNRKSILDVQLGDHQESEMTVMFCDLRGFTGMSETMTPAETLSFLNGHFMRMSPIIQRNGGFIDKYMGDGIMAFFPKSSVGGLRAAVEMQQTIREYNLERMSYDRSPLRMGIGINSGSIVFGTVGWAEQMQITVISDCVNVSARIESLCKILGSKVLIGQATMEQATQQGMKFRSRFIGTTPIRGKLEAIQIFEILDVYELDQQELLLDTKELFESAIKALDNGDFEDAATLLMKVLGKNPSDQVARALLEDCSLGRGAAARNQAA